MFGFFALTTITFYFTSLISGNSNVIQEHCKSNEHIKHINFACDLYNEEVQINNGYLTDESHFSTFIIKDLKRMKEKSGYLENLSLFMQDVKTALNIQYLYIVFSNIKGKNLQVIELKALISFVT